MSTLIYRLGSYSTRAAWEQKSNGWKTFILLLYSANWTSTVHGVRFFSFAFLSIHLFLKKCLSAFYVPGTDPGIGDKQWMKWWSDCKRKVQRTVDRPSWLYQGPVSQMLAISNCPLPSSHDNIMRSWGFSSLIGNSSATLTILWDKATIMIISSMQLEKSAPNRMTHTQALPTQPFSCPPWALSQSQAWPPSLGKALASV